MSDETRQRVLLSAGPIFADKGYESATVREICSAAGTNLASVNYHFRDKEGLYLETVKLAHQLRVQQVPQPSLANDATPKQRLREFIGVMLSRMLGANDLGWQSRLMIREMLQPTAACKDLVEDYIRPQLGLLLDILDDLLPDETDPHCRLQIAFSIVGQCLHYRVAREFVALLIPENEWQQHYTIEQLADHITEFSMAALTTLSRDSQSSEKNVSAHRQAATELSDTGSIP